MNSCMSHYKGVKGTGLQMSFKKLNGSASWQALYGGFTSIFM